MEKHALSFAHLQILSLLSTVEAGGEDPQNYWTQYGFFKHDYRLKGVSWPKDKHESTITSAAQYWLL